MLGDILFSIPLLVTHLVTTFYVSDNHDILGAWHVVPSSKLSMPSRCVWFDGLSGQTERETMLILCIETIRTHRISPTTIAMITY